MTPYWQSEDGMIRVFCAKYEDVLAAGVVDVARVALIHDDPQYGIALDTRARWPWLADFPAVTGDDKPYDPSGVLAMDRPLVSWGANHYASRMPDARGWLAWDKATKNDLDLKQAEMEFAWSNITARPQCFRHMWSGAFRDSERGTRFHPTQKPVALSTWVYQRARLKPGDLVFVPHGGSGPDLPACRAAGLRLAWVECERVYCDTAIARLGAVTAARAAEPAGPLFAAARAQVPA